MFISHPLTYVKMKTFRAQEHFKVLEKELGEWNGAKRYSISTKTDLTKGLEIVHVQATRMPDIIPMLLGDFLCCLRSALDQLAWGLATFRPTRTFTEREERQIHFPIVKIKDSTYEKRLLLFPLELRAVLDEFQPYHRVESFGDDPLWQLNELWTLDKHRSIPMNDTSLNVQFPFERWTQYQRESDFGIEVHFPLSMAWLSEVDLEPKVVVDVLFGQGTFEVSLFQLREINHFVRDKVIPRFAGFFPPPVKRD